MSRHSQGAASTAAAAVASLCLAFVVGCGSDSKPVQAPPAAAPRSPTASSASSSTAKPGTASAAASSSSAAAPARQTVATANGLEQFRANLAQGDQQIDRTLASLAEVTDPNQQDLRGAFDRYCDNLARMREQSDVVHREADEMRASRDQYFAKWEQRVTEIDNPTIRASAEARRKRLRDAHEQIVTASSEAKDAYVPFMKDLEDIRKYLANDLSKSAIGDLGDAVKKVQADGQAVKGKIASILQTLDSVQGGA
jgi:hypothetical protein